MYKRQIHHTYWAIDIQATEGQPIFASGSGLATVTTDSTTCDGYGRSVTVDHNGRKSLYAHMSAFSAALAANPVGGVWVDRNTVIGYVGHTGNTSGCSYNHLHYEESSSGAFREGASDPGPFMACLGTTLKTYPRAMDETSWQGFTAHVHIARTDGGQCDPPPGTDPRPAGSYVQDAEGHPFQVVGGSLVHSDGDEAGGTLPKVLPIVDPNLYLPSPADGTAVQARDSAVRYVFAGGAPLRIDDWAAIGSPSARIVSDSALTASSNYSWGHVRAVPLTGTVLHGVPTLGNWKVVNGGRMPVGPTPGSVTVTDAAILSILRFNDVPPSVPFAADIAWLDQTGITTGNPDGSYGYYAPVSRQAMAAFIYRYAGSPNGAKPTCSVAPKTDVPKTSMFCGEITWLIAQGITKGYPDGSFHPTESISREAMAAFMYRFAGKPNGEQPTCETAPKIDIPVGRVFCGEIAWMIASGISTGFPDSTFRPNLLVQRSSMAAFLHRLLPVVPRP